MIEVIILFGFLTLLAGTLIAINPDVIFGFLRKNLDKLGLHVFAVVIRLVLGVLLIYQSHASKYPFLIEIIGWLSIIAALFLALIGRRRFTRFMSWALSQVKPIARIGGLFAMLFGAFIIYAFI